MTRLRWLGCALLTWCLCSSAPAADWIHWRGPEQTGHARDTGLPSEWDPVHPGSENLIWKLPIGFRSTPLIMGGKIYIINAVGDVPRPQTQADKLVTGERILCLEAKDGKGIWDRRLHVLLSPILHTPPPPPPLPPPPRN